MLVKGCVEGSCRGPCLCLTVSLLFECGAKESEDDKRCVFFPVPPLVGCLAMRGAQIAGSELIETGDDPPSSTLSNRAGLCSPADSAVNVKRLLGHHQSSALRNSPRTIGAGDTRRERERSC